MIGKPQQSDAACSSQDIADNVQSPSPKTVRKISIGLGAVFRDGSIRHAGFGASAFAVGTVTSCFMLLLVGQRPDTLIIRPYRITG